MNTRSVRHSIERHEQSMRGGTREKGVQQVQQAKQASIFDKPASSKRPSQSSEAYNTPPPYRLTHVYPFLAFGLPGFFLSTLLGSLATHPALLKLVFNPGSCAINAFPIANVNASACPVVPPPCTFAHTLYLSVRPVAFNAQITLARSCARAKAMCRGFPLTRTSPSPSTTHAFAEEALRRPTAAARPSGSMRMGAGRLLKGWMSRAQMFMACCTDAGTSDGWMVFIRFNISSMRLYLLLRTFSSVMAR